VQANRSFRTRGTSPFQLLGNEAGRSFPPLIGCWPDLVLAYLRRKVHRYKRREGARCSDAAIYGIYGTGPRSQFPKVRSPASGRVWLRVRRGHSLAGHFYDRHFRHRRRRHRRRRRRHRRRRPRRHPARLARTKKSRSGWIAAHDVNRSRQEAIIYNRRSFLELLREARARTNRIFLLHAGAAARKARVTSARRVAKKRDNRSVSPCVCTCTCTWRLMRRLVSSHRPRALSRNVARVNERNARNVALFARACHCHDHVDARDGKERPVSRYLSPILRSSTVERIN